MHPMHEEVARAHMRARLDGARRSQQSRQLARVARRNRQAERSRRVRRVRGAVRS
jgi:hypothetical protein